MLYLRDRRKCAFSSADHFPKDTFVSALLASLFTFFKSCLRFTAVPNCSLEQRKMGKRLHTACCSLIVSDAGEGKGLFRLEPVSSIFFLPYAERINARVNVCKKENFISRMHDEERKKIAAVHETSQRTGWLVINYSSVISALGIGKSGRFS